MKNAFRSETLSAQDKWADSTKAKETAYTPSTRVGPDVAKDVGGKLAIAKLLAALKGKR